MPKSKPHEFKLRVSPELWAIIDQTRGKKSLNRQINDWLWAMAEPDEADEVAAALRQLLKSLSEEDRAIFVKHATGALKLLAGSLRTTPSKATRKPRSKPSA